jgi:hypothetical protein
MGIVVAPLHLEVCVVFGSPSSSSSSSIDLLFDVLLDMVETFPPLRIRRRLVPMGPGKLNFPGGAGSAVVAMVKKVGWKFDENKAERSNVFVQGFAVIQIVAIWEGTSTSNSFTFPAFRFLVLL